MKTELSPQQPVAEVMARYPTAIPVFLHFHMGCVGCSMSAFETLQDVAKNYHLDVDAFLAALDAAIEQPSGREQSI